MFVEIAYGVFLAGSFAYYRYKDITKKWDGSTAREIEIPRIKEGATHSYVYGRCRVREPILAWAGFPYHGEDNADVPSLYCINMLYLAGIPFRNGVNKIHNVYQGDLRLTRDDSVGGIGNSDLDELTGEGNNEHTTRAAIVWNPGDMNDQTGAAIGGGVEFLNGNTEQLLVGPAPTYTPLTKAGHYMTDADVTTIPPERVPGYRGHLGVFLYNRFGLGWSLGFQATVQSIQFEMSSYPAGAGLAGTPTVGQEANPADVLWDLFTSSQKLGIPLVSMDLPSFTAAAITLLDEGHGYSRAIEEAGDAEQFIDEICRQIDAIVFVDPTTRKIKIKLVRGDYDPATVTHFTPANCLLENWIRTGFTGTPDKLRVVFNDRQEHYRDNSATAHNQANAVGQDGQVDELVLQMPGICTLEQAQDVASRELSFVSRPLIACRIITGRWAAGLLPGDVVALSWPEYGIGRAMLRIAKVGRGSLSDDQIVLDVIQDFFHEHRGLLDLPEYPGVPAHR